MQLPSRGGILPFSSSFPSLQSFKEFRDKNGGLMKLLEEPTMEAEKVFEGVLKPEVLGLL